MQARDLEDPRIDLVTSASEIGDLIFHSPLFIAIELDNLDLVKEFIVKGANPLDSDGKEFIAVHYAASRGRLKILKYLVEDIGCNPATGGGDVCNVIHVAADQRQTEIVKYLVKQCQVDPLTFDTKKLSINILLLKR